MANPHEETAKAGGKRGYSSPTNQGSDHSHSRFEPGSGYYGGKKSTTPTSTNGGGNGGGGKGGDGSTKYKSNIKVTGPVTGALWLADTVLGPYTTAYNKKKRTEFARNEGLFRDWAKTNQYSKTPTLDVMSDKGKDYLKEAGYGPFQDKKNTGGGDGGQQRCPDGTLPPCTPTTTAAPVAPTTTTSKSSWQLYPEGSDYITGQGYDTGGGVRKGPPPKRGPNPQVPPLLFSRGGGAAVRGTKFKGVK